LRGTHDEVQIGIAPTDWIPISISIPSNDFSLSHSPHVG
jgi:hypothetical protein